VLLSELTSLRSEIRRFDGSDLSAALIRHLLLAVLLRVLRWGRASFAPADAASLSPSPYRVFHGTVEADFRRMHKVHDYARRLGYSVSTLNRACYRAEGCTAKSVIDRRIALEAQRLLIHSRATLVELSHYLGYSEASNFAKFFARVTGCSPSAIRRGDVR